MIPEWQSNCPESDSTSIQINMGSEENDSLPSNGTLGRLYVYMCGALVWITNMLGRESSQNNIDNNKNSIMNEPSENLSQHNLCKSFFFVCFGLFIFGFFLYSLVPKEIKIVIIHNIQILVFLAILISMVFCVLAWLMDNTNSTMPIVRCCFNNI